MLWCAAPQAWRRQIKKKKKLTENKRNVRSKNQRKHGLQTCLPAGQPCLVWKEKDENREKNKAKAKKVSTKKKDKRRWMGKKEKKTERKQKRKRKASPKPRKCKRPHEKKKSDQRKYNHQYSARNPKAKHHL